MNYIMQAAIYETDNKKKQAITDIAFVLLINIIGRNKKAIRIKY